MKYVVFILSLLVSFGVVADPRINQDINTCHTPKHPNDTDDELKHTCKIVLDEDSGQNAVAGFGVLEMKGIPLLTRVDREGVSADPSTRPGNYTVTSDNNNETCVLRNDDGTETTTNDWAIVFESDCTGAGPTFCDFTYRIFCGYDTAEILEVYPNN